MSDSDKERWDDDFNQHREQEREEAAARGDEGPRESIVDQINAIPDEDWGDEA